MPQIYSRYDVAAKITEGVEAVKIYRRGEPGSVDDYIADELKREPRTIKSWKTKTPDIRDGIFWGFIYLVLRTGNVDLSWLIELLKGTSVPFYSPLSPQLLRAYLSQARLQGTALTEQQIADIVNMFFDEDFGHPISVLWDAETTECVERNSTTVFLATPDFYWEYDDPQWAKILYENLVTRSVKQYHLYPDTLQNREKVFDMQRDLENSVIGSEWKNRIHYVGVNEKEFIWYREHVFYNPHGVYGRSGFALEISRVYERFSDKDIYDMNILLTRNEARFFRNQFIELWNSRVEDEQWRLPDVPVESTTSELNDTRLDSCLKYWKVIQSLR